MWMFPFIVSQCMRIVLGLAYHPKGLERVAWNALDQAGAHVLTPAPRMHYPGAVVVGLCDVVVQAENAGQHLVYALDLDACGGQVAHQLLGFCATHAVLGPRAAQAVHRRPPDWAYHSSSAGSLSRPRYRSWGASHHT